MVTMSLRETLVRPLDSSGPCAGVTPPGETAPSASRFVLLPPPNVTGDLHLGHGFSFTLLDTYVRYFRQQGESVSFRPGTEHAGSRAEIAYSRLSESEKENLNFRAWQDKTRKSIIKQIAAMGVNADWDDEYSSMDERRVAFMRDAFVQLSGDGYIYPSTEMVNWCPCCRSSVPDIDVKFASEPRMRYFLSRPGHHQGITIATFHIETLLTAAAIAIPNSHPQADELIGTTIRLFDRDIEIQKDTRGVLDGASYAIILNPALNPGDFQTLAPHGFINTYGEDGNVDRIFVRHRGPTLGETRELLEQALMEERWTVSKEAVEYQTPHCAICASPIHPMLSEQWYFDLSKGLEQAGKIPEFRSALWKKGFELWLDKLRRPVKNHFHEMMNTSYYGGYSTNTDFLVSSQSRWGQRLPVWHCQECNSRVVSLAQPNCCPTCRDRRFIESRDVISVFFSCCLMGASTNPNPERGNAVDFTVCGHDIYHYWGSLKNILASALGYEAGFGNLMVHGLLVDASGEKMTKSKGNVVSLLPLIEKYGIEAMRGFVYECVSENHDKPFIRFNVEEIATARARVSELEKKLMESEIVADASGAITGSDLNSVSQEIRTFVEDHKIGHGYRRLLSLVHGPRALFASPQVKHEFLRMLAPFHPSLSTIETTREEK